MAQVEIGDWKALTSPLIINDITYVGEDIYAATKGGLFHFSNNQTKTFTTIEGLVGVDLNQIATDHLNQVWIGGATPAGFLQVYNPFTEQSVHIFDYDLTEIIDIQINGNKAWVSFMDGQDIGIMKFIFTDKWEYRDSFRNFPQETGGFSSFIVTDSLLLIGTNNGIYKGNTSNNLKDPTNWITFSDNLIYDITSMGKSDYGIIFSTATDLYHLNINGGTWDQIQNTSGTSFSDINYVNISERIFFRNGNSFWKVTSVNNDTYDFELINHNRIINCVATNDDEYVLGTNLGALLFDNYENGTSLIPNAPMVNHFISITVMDDGRLVGGSKNGLSIYDGEGWRNIIRLYESDSDTIHETYDYSSFIADTIPVLFGEYIADLEQGPDGRIYCAIRGTYPAHYSDASLRGGGVVSIDIDNPGDYTIIDTTILSYHTTLSNQTPYMVVLDLEFDNSNHLWVANPYCINKNNPIHVNSPNGDWRSYGSSETSTRISQSPVSITIDSWGRTWYSAFQAEEANLGIYPNGGIFMLDYDGTPTDPTSFSWTKVQENGTVWSLGMGLNNRLYYLTPSGLNYFDLRNSSNPVIQENSTPFFPNVSFGSGSGIKVDHQGNIWTYSPTDGIHVLLENATYWPDIYGIQADNSPMLSNEVTDIAFDSKSNLAYIATSKGVNVLKIPFGNEQKSYSNLKVFPSPFYIPNQKKLIVDGLPFESSMMVMTLDGKIIRKIPSQGLSIDGNQLSWDGRDDLGDFVSSGVYLLAIYGDDGNQTVNKITVINH